MLDDSRSRARASFREKLLVAVVLVLLLIPTAGLRVHAAAATVGEARGEPPLEFIAGSVAVAPGIATRLEIMKMRANSDPPSFGSAALR